MKQSCLLIGAALLCLSSGCSAADRADETAKAETARAEPPAASRPASTPASAPAVAEGYDWAMRVNDEERVQDAILAYEMDGTDDQPLHFTCEEGGNRIFAGLNGGPADLRAITLASGDQTLRLSGKTEETEIAELPSFTTEEIAGTSPFIRAFSANGWLRMTADGATTDMAATASGKEAIQRFVKFCIG